MPPTVLLSPSISGDPSAGIRDASDFARRLKGQAQDVTILWLCEAGVAAPGGACDGRVERPNARLFRTPSAANELERLAQALRAEWRAEPARHETPSEVETAGVADSFRDASSRGEILPLLMQHARQGFARVAMFMVRDETLLGIAQSGLACCDGPDDHGMRAVEVPAESSSWLRRVLMTRRPLVAAPQDDGDHAFAARLGSRAPAEAYLAPIESGGEIVAMLYADNLPEDDPVGDTAAIEHAVHEAGVALDREVRERTGEPRP